MVIEAVLGPVCKPAEFTVRVSVTVLFALSEPPDVSNVSHEKLDSAFQCAMPGPELVSSRVTVVVLLVAILTVMTDGLWLSDASDCELEPPRNGNIWRAFALIVWQLLDGHKSGRTTATKPRSRSNTKRMTGMSARAHLPWRSNAALLVVQTRCSSKGIIGAG